MQINVYTLHTRGESAYKLATTDICEEISELALVSCCLVS